MAVSGALVCAGCSGGSGSSTGSKPIVAVSIPPQESLLREIAGDSVDIVTLMRSDGNAESFEVSVSDLRLVNSASAYMLVGNLPFEGELADKIGETNRELRFFDTSSGVELLHGTHGHHHHHQGDGHGAGDADPHTWSSARNLKIMASSMTEALAEVDAPRADFYRANLQRLEGRLDSIDRALADKLSQSRGASFLIWHPSLSYFARDYGLRQIPLGQDNKEMSVVGLKDNIRKAADTGVRAIFIQSNYDPAQAGNVARQLGIEPVAINPLDPDWETQFNIITDAIISSK